MDYLFNLVQNQAFIGVVASISVVFIGFVFNEHLRSYKERRRGVAILERIIRHNHTRLSKNTELLEKWVECLDKKRTYQCNFSQLNTLNIEDTLHSRNIELINLLIKQNDFFIDYNEDLIGNFYASYEQVKVMVADGKIDEKGWIEFQNNLHSQIKIFPDKSKVQEDELLKLLAMIRVEWSIQRLSLVGFLYWLMLLNIGPRVTKEKIDTEFKRIKASLK